MTSTEDHIKNSLLIDMPVWACKVDMQRLGLKEDQMITEAEDRGAELRTKCVSFAESRKEMEAVQHLLFFSGLASTAGQSPGRESDTDEAQRHPTRKEIVHRQEMVWRRCWNHTPKTHGGRSGGGKRSSRTPWAFTIAEGIEGLPTRASQGDDPRHRLRIPRRQDQDQGGPGFHAFLGSGVHLFA